MPIARPLHAVRALSLVLVAPLVAACGAATGLGDPSLDGGVRPPVHDAAPPNDIVPPPHDVVPPLDGSGDLCADSSECGPDGVCVGEGTGCAAPGHCAPRPMSCGDIYRPVCGCDGMTYDNECDARAVGARIAFEGTCEGPPPPIDVVLLPDNVPPPDVEPPIDVEPPLDVLRPDVAPPLDVPPPPPDASPTLCTTAADCPPNAYCDAPRCGRLGACVRRPDACPPGGPPVCSCDRVTFMNECLAHAAGASVAFLGPCEAPDSGPPPPMDGGPPHFDGGPGSCSTPRDCPAAAFCELLGCGTVGYCSPRSVPCDPGPVCGCDGHTYPTACEAARLGISTEHPGACGIR